MNTNSVLRANARAQLGDNIFGNTWIMALVACLLNSVIIGAASMLPVLGSILVMGFLSFGLARIWLQLIRGQKNTVDVGDLFCGTAEFVDLLVLSLLQTLFILLWSLLFIIPGIVKSYAYALCFFIKHDHPDYTWQQCLDESQRLMKGYKMQLFCLHLSFIGWILLSLVTCGIALLWVDPYMQLSVANFYENRKAIDNPNP